MRALLYLIFLTGVIQAGRPNVILVVSDDQGFGDLSCHGNPILRTPNLDRLHSESLRFTNFHVAPMCTPTRGQLMTGCDAIRNGALNVSSGRSLADPSFPMMPELFAKSGYSTGLFGKWHLGDNHPYRPQDRGLQESVTFPSSHIGSVPDHWNNDYFDDTYLHNGIKQEYVGYTTDVFFSEAIDWMKRKAENDKPFFLYLPTAAPHQPHYVPVSYRVSMEKRIAETMPETPELDPRKREQLIRFLAMIENFDTNFGRLETFLGSSGLRENTILVFMSDNGSTFGEKYYNAGMRGGKTTLWEGGHRVPLFIRWPAGKLGAARDISSLTQAQDILPTLLEMTGTEGRPFDGKSLLPLVRGDVSSFAERPLFINYSRMPFARKVPEGVDPSYAAHVRMEGAAVLWENWRWLNDRELYDLSKDPMQLHDVAEEHPEIAAKMAFMLREWWEKNSATANSPRSVDIGHGSEPVTMLTACEWWDVFVDQQAQVRRGDRKTGVWHLNVVEAGRYEIELRRWPAEAGLGLAGGAPPAVLTDGSLPPGKALPISMATLRIGKSEKKITLPERATAATFKMDLPVGKTTMKGDFLNGNGDYVVGAYYAYVRKFPGE